MGHCHALSLMSPIVSYTKAQKLSGTQSLSKVFFFFYHLQRNLQDPILTPSTWTTPTRIAPCTPRPACTASTPTAPHWNFNVAAFQHRQQSMFWKGLHHTGREISCLMRCLHHEAGYSLTRATWPTTTAFFTRQEHRPSSNFCHHPCGILQWRKHAPVMQAGCCICSFWTPLSPPFSSTKIHHH